MDSVKVIDPVKVMVMWQATCDDCGWHTPPTTPNSVVREWARLHRLTCPLKKQRNDDSAR